VALEGDLHLVAENAAENILKYFPETMTNASVSLYKIPWNWQLLAPIFLLYLYRAELRITAEASMSYFIHVRMISGHWKWTVGTGRGWKGCSPGGWYPSSPDLNKNRSHGSAVKKLYL
jgi:hypothetical protein